MMITDFTQLPLVVRHEFVGGVGETLVHSYEDDVAKLMTQTVQPGASIGIHTHHGTGEMMYVISGAGICHDDGTDYPFTPGMCHYCPEGHVHGVINTGDTPLVMLAVLFKKL